MSQITYEAVPDRGRPGRVGASTQWAAEIAMNFRHNTYADEYMAKLPTLYLSKASAASMAGSIKRGRSKGWADHGPWDATVRKEGDGYRVYVRPSRDSNTPSGGVS